MQQLQTSHPTMQSPAHSTEEFQSSKQQMSKSSSRRPYRQSKSFDIPRPKWTPGVIISPMTESRQTPLNRPPSSRRVIRPSKSFDVSFLKATPQPRATTISPSQQEVISILQDDVAFQTLKTSLRQRGCVTNAYLKENFHFYVKHVQAVRKARVQQQQCKQQIRQDADTDPKRNLQDIARRQMTAAA